MELMLLPGEYSVARYPLDTSPEMPPLAERSGLVSVTWTGEECSLVCLKEKVPAGYEVISEGWAALKIEGVVDFGLVGVLASIIIPLGQVGVSVFTMSTYNTDYVLVKSLSLDSAVSALRGAGFVVGIK
jgi:uncharacterized protein